MRKLRLNPEDLGVESFETAEGARDHGTVLANENEPYTGPRCTIGTNLCGTCYLSCNYTACPIDCPETQEPCGPIYITYDHC